MKLVFATHNSHKLREVQDMIGNKVDLISLLDLEFNEDIAEPFPSLEENALIKARTIHQRFNMNCFAEDTGLEIDSLGGEPGVLSARYAGENKNSEENIRLVLSKMKGITNRSAQFRTVLALILNNKEYFFEGIIRGNISAEKSGTKGFGYDPIFVPLGYTKSFAEMTAAEKNKISHRYKAIEQLAIFLKHINNGEN
ncbi:MAG: RdgB/HAM1 family non-canonical purine NTP pyrophosphatase [Sphingobacteriales bacterium]|nr:MAG: RdgB/HAM1 family non-canonical purine NTP pyrophosphatase [Sphingobacteriales bacterium]